MKLYGANCTYTIRTFVQIIIYFKKRVMANNCECNFTHFIQNKFMKILLIQMAINMSFPVLISKSRKRNTNFTRHRRLQI